MQLQILKESEIQDRLDQAIKKTLISSFAGDEEVFTQTRAFNGNIPLYTAIAQDGDIVCSHVAVVDRTILVGQKQFRAAAVANVCTSPEYRGNKMVDAVLMPAMEHAENLGFDFGLLFTSHSLKKMYARNGWLEVVDQKFITTKNGAKSEFSPEGAKMFYPLQLKEFPPGDVDLMGIDW